MGVPPNGALDMTRNLHLIISYLLRNEWEDLEFKLYG